MIQKIILNFSIVLLYTKNFRYTPTEKFYNNMYNILYMEVKLMFKDTNIIITTIRCIFCVVKIYNIIIFISTIIKNPSNH